MYKNPEDAKEYGKRYRALNSARILKYRREWYLKNRDKKCQYDATYRQKDIEAHNAKKRERSLVYKLDPHWVETRKAQQRARYLRNKGQILAKCSSAETLSKRRERYHKSDGAGKHLAYCRTHREVIKRIQDNRREELCDTYVATIIIGKSGLPRELVPKELIELKREHLKLSRKLKQNERSRA